MDQTFWDKMREILLEIKDHLEKEVGMKVEDSTNTPSSFKSTTEN